MTCPCTRPRDRYASFEPQLVKKRQTRFIGFGEKILVFAANIRIKSNRTQFSPGFLG
jgi:transposase-like protein